VKSSFERYQPLCYFKEWRNRDRGGQTLGLHKGPRNAWGNLARDADKPKDGSFILVLKSRLVVFLMSDIVYFNLEPLLKAGD